MKMINQDLVEILSNSTPETYLDELLDYCLTMKKFQIAEKVLEQAKPTYSNYAKYKQILIRLMADG